MTEQHIEYLIRTAKNEIRREGSLIYVRLTRGYETVAWLESLPLIAPYKWRADEKNRYDSKHHPRGSKAKSFVYARATVGDQSGILMHRHLCGCVKGDGLQVDHDNEDTLDNRRNNLVVLTRAEHDKRTVARRRMRQLAEAA